MRPLKNAKVFAKKMIKNWNKQAKRGDVIYILGDFIDCDGKGFDGWKEYLPWVKKLKAEVVLIMGNNEDRVVKHFFNNSYDDFKHYCLELGFSNVYKRLEIDINGNAVYLAHKPLNCKMNMINLFGHVHAAGGIYFPWGLNVGCDLFNYKLLSEKDILHLLEKKEKYWHKSIQLNWWKKIR